VSSGQRIGCVVIGRNEAEHIAAALASVRAAGLPCVYVDSASSDGSPAIARTLADLVIEVDPSRPMSAARGRNEGFAALTAHWPDLDYVMFLDGDCTLYPAFVPAAAATLDIRGEVAVVVGVLVERLDERNIYSRLAALEWFSTTGDIADFGNLGGIMMARVADFRRVGGFNARIVAGEDSEFGVRLALAGRVTTKIDEPMAQHDAGITSFAQWWTRSVRAGHALAERYMLHGRSRVRDCRREFIRTLFWGFVVPLAALVPAWWTHGLSLLLLLGYGASFFKQVAGAMRRGHSLGDALLEARFGFYHKIANSIGLVKYFRRRLTGEIKIIEHPQPAIKESVS
jgi:GT2 family glycosyltransferase